MHYTVHGVFFLIIHNTCALSRGEGLNTRTMGALSDLPARSKVMRFLFEQCAAGLLQNV